MDKPYILPGNAGNNIRTALNALHECEREIATHDLPPKLPKVDK